MRVGVRVVGDEVDVDDVLDEDDVGIDGDEIPDERRERRERSRSFSSWAELSFGRFGVAACS